jgi:dihydroflavonol-4-reductase
MQDRQIGQRFRKELPMKAFVTGATGFMGVTLVQELVAAGWEVVALQRPTSDISELRKLGVALAIGDVTDADSLAAACPSRVDAIFHTAGSVGFHGAEDDRTQHHVNVHGTENMVRLALRIKAGRFIHTSSVLTFDYSGGRRISETTPLTGDSSRFTYIRTKRLGELAVERATAAGLNAVIMHPSAIFGAYDKATWSRLFSEINKGVWLPGLMPGKASCCHMRPVVRAHIAAFERAPRGARYLLGGPDASFQEIVAEIGRILEKNVPQRVLPAWLFKLFGSVEYRSARALGREPMLNPALAAILCETVLCNSDKAVRDLNYQPSSLHTMLLDCYDWMRRDGRL